MRDAMKELLRAARQAAQNSGDPEVAHSQLDDALYAFVAAVDPKGAEKLSKITAGMTLWYA